MISRAEKTQRERVAGETGGWPRYNGRESRYALGWLSAHRSVARQAPRAVEPAPVSPVSRGCTPHARSEPSLGCGERPPMAMPEFVIDRIGPFDVPGLRARRWVRVYAPPGVGPSSAVLYVFDGQNVFHDAPSYAGGWHLHR